MPPRNLTLVPPPAPDQHVSAELLRQYAAGTLVPAQQYHVEAHTSDCARCAEVLEGLSVTDYATTERGLASVRSRLHTRLAVDAARHSHRYAAWTGVAATLLLLVVAASVFWLNSRPFMARRTPVANTAAEVPILAPQVGTPAAEQLAPFANPAAPVAPLVAAAPRANATPEAGLTAVSPQPQVAYQSRIVPPRVRHVGSALAGSATTRQPAKVISANAVFTNQLASATTTTSTSTLTSDAASPAAEAYSVVVAAMEPRPSSALRAIALSAPRVEGVKLPAVAMAGSTAKPTEVATAATATNKAGKLPSVPAAAAPVAGGRTAMQMPPSPDLASVPLGGHAAFRRYLKKELKFPEADRAKGVEGVVKLRFVVAADGSLQDIKVVSPVSEECDAEAIRLLKEGPAWYPAIVRGKRVPTVMRVSVTFNPLE
ncbi:energy transducer TonB [Hymenobacter guriensis]|uniref:TonB family protein n=1 Tax=Hymenobacter guriensis TaxID=2793065 RepID=A0ABS0L386_9BACT|nr:energy transducer TonB [Hymenobacter guriensis]MBG8554572.1 TonB family protein [Hymenobacter guriensis]